MSTTAIVEEIKSEYEIVLNNFDIIDKRDMHAFEDTNIFELHNGLILYSDDWYDLDYDN